MQIKSLEVRKVKSNMIDPKTKEVYEIGVIRSAQLGQFIGKKVNIEVTEVN
jgi:hypothetical protein